MSIARPFLFAMLFLVLSFPVLGTDARVAPADPRGGIFGADRLNDDRGDYRSDAADRESLTLTVYQDGKALVHDRRDVGLVAGKNRIALADVSPRLLPESVQVSGDGEPVVRAQRYEQALLTADALLRAHVGREITLVRDRDGDEERQTARLLSVAGSAPLVSVNDRVELLDARSPWRIAFSELPDGLHPEAALVLDMETGLPGRQHLELFYLTRGLHWQTDYVLTLDDEVMGLTAWASIENATGIPLERARLRLVAGEPHNAGAPTPRDARVAALEADAEARAEGGYQMFRLADAVTLGADERTQLPLFRAADVPVTREYRVEGGAWGRLSGERASTVNVHLRFDNSGDALGRAMPSGIARVYQADSEGETLFLGQDRIDSTPAGNTVELRVGTAFDVTALRSQTHYRRLDERSEEQGWRIRLANAGDAPVEVRVIENIPGDWTILQASAPHEKPSANRAEWTIEVPAEGRTELTYRVEVRR